jgi:hypothetical protein
VPYREAIRDFLVQGGISADHDGDEDSYIVRVMTLTDHYHRQTERRTKAYIILFTAAVFWPVLVLLLLAAMWVGEQLMGLCVKNPHRMH